jgi:hypothetical protein
MAPMATGMIRAPISGRSLSTNVVATSIGDCRMRARGDRGLSDGESRYEALVDAGKSIRGTPTRKG